MCKAAGNGFCWLFVKNFQETFLTILTSHRLETGSIGVPPMEREDVEGRTGGLLIRHEDDEDASQQ